MHDADVDYRQAVALFRYGLIADLVRLEPGHKGLYAQIEQKAAGEYTIPGSNRTRVAAETLRDWLKALSPRRLRCPVAEAARRPRPVARAACGGRRCAACDQGGQSRALRADWSSVRHAQCPRSPPSCPCQAPPSTACSPAMG